MSDLIHAKDDRPGKVKIHSGGLELKAPFRALRLPSNAAADVVVTIVSGGEQVALPFTAGEMWQVTGEKIVSVVPADDIAYWTV